jgi:hypothetical protein
MAKQLPTPQSCDDVEGLVQHLRTLRNARYVSKAVKVRRVTGSAQIHTKDQSAIGQVIQRDRLTNYLPRVLPREGRDHSAEADTLWRLFPSLILRVAICGWPNTMNLRSVEEGVDTHSRGGWSVSTKRAVSVRGTNELVLDSRRLVRSATFRSGSNPRLGRGLFYARRFNSGRLL